MNCRLAAAVSAILVLCGFGPGVAPAQAQNTLFFEGFDDAYEQTWDGTAGLLPNQSLVPFREQTVTHVGDTGRTLSTVDGAGVAVLNTVNAPAWTRYGCVASPVFSMEEGIVEARINTLEQGGSNIDGLFDLWLLNADDHSRYVHVGLFGDMYDTIRSWIYVSSGSPVPLSGPDTLPSFAYESNTWYRVRITQRAGALLHVSVLTDDTKTELVSYDFDLTLASVGSRFQIGISQWMGGPDGTHSMLSAVDYVVAQAVYDPSDLDGDGFPDLLLQNQSDRRIALLTMHGTSIVSSGSITPTLPTGWRVSAAADFSGDGRNDILVQNTLTRAVSILVLNGRVVQSSMPVNPTLPAGWSVCAAGDVSGDGMPDIVVQNVSTGRIAVLIMNGAKIMQSRSFSKGLTSGWSVVGAADFTADGQIDLVVQNATTRQISILVLAGTTVVGSSPVNPTLPAGWSVAGIGDYNRDGRPDLMVQNAATRQISLLAVVAGRVSASIPVTPTAPAGWVLVGPR